MNRNSWCCRNIVGIYGTGTGARGFLLTHGARCDPNLPYGDQRCRRYSGGTTQASQESSMGGFFWATVWSPQSTFRVFRSPLKQLESTQRATLSESTLPGG